MSYAGSMVLCVGKQELRSINTNAGSKFLLNKIKKNSKMFHRKVYGFAFLSRKKYATMEKTENNTVTEKERF